MFETLFCYPRVLARHRAGPAAEERDRFLAHHAQVGAAPKSLSRLASELLLVARRIDVSGPTVVTPREIEAAADGWVGHQRRHHRVRDPKFCRQRFVQVATDWLRFLDRLQATQEQPGADADLGDEFANYMRLERGLSSRTIHNRCWHVQAFLDWLGAQGHSIAEVSLGQVDAFLAMRGAQSWCRVSIATAASALRSFFVRMAVHGRCADGFAAGIQGPRLFKHESLPVGPQWKDVQRLIASADTDSPQDIRDRAILLLLAVYGLPRPSPRRRPRRRASNGASWPTSSASPCPSWPR